MEEEAKKEVEEVTTNQEDASPDKPKDSPEVEDTTQKTQQDKEQEETESKDEVVTLSKEEAEKLRKKAQDFDNSVELKRLAKLNAKKRKEEGGSDEQPNSDEILAELDSLRAELASLKTKSHNTELTDVYREFIKTHKWADDDAKFAAISQRFNTEGAESSQDLLSRLKAAALEAFPQEFNKQLENNIRAQVLAEKQTIGAGDIGGGNSVKKNEQPQEVTAEDKRIADKFFGGNIERYLKTKE